jgi:hypothetical protein
MKLIQTTISETTVRLRYADNEDAAKATQWMDFQFPLSDLRNPEDPTRPLGHPRVRFLAEVERSALRHARGVIGEETKRLSDLLDQHS